MLKRFSFFVFLFACLIITGLDAKAANSVEISNSFFSFSMPDELLGTYTVEKISNGIFISETTSKRAGIGGFAFGVKIFKMPNEYADMPGNKKLGELIAKNGTIYDMVLMRPTEIQYGEGKQTEKIYNRLYDFGNKIEIKAVNGNKYVKNRRMKGEDLYGDVLKTLNKAIKEKWNSKQYEKADMSYMYYLLETKKENVLDKIGYVYYDINSDGIDELLIGEIKEPKDNDKGIIYDIYTMVDRKPTHVLSGGDVNKYFVCEDYFICNDYSSDSKMNNFEVFVLENNSKEIYKQVTYLYDKSSWFLSYGNSKEWKNISKKEYNKGKNLYIKKYKRFDYIPIADIK